jgi:hypothetical protein
VELENEFGILRALINDVQRPTAGAEENLMLKHQYQEERGMRINAEGDVNRLRQ